MRTVRLAVVALAFAAFFTAFFAPALGGGRYLTDGGDGLEIALPFYLVPHGLWEPDIMLGYPWAWNLNGYWDPLVALHWIPHSFDAYMIAAYAIAATGAFAVVDELTGSAIGGTVAGISYALGGFMIGHLGHYDVVHPAAWVPYVLWAFVAQRRGAGVRAIALGAMAIALCALAGQPQVLAYTLVLALAYVATMAASWSGRRRFAAGAAATFGLGICLAAVALAPGALLALSSFRAAPSLPYFLSVSIPPWQLPLRIVLPYFLGQSNQSLYPYSTIGIDSNVEFASYAGIITLLLALVAVQVRRRDRNVIFFAAAAAAALLLSTGDGLHVDAITFHIPLLNLFRAQARHVLEFTLLAAVLAGIGAAELVRGTVPLRALVTSIVAIAALFAASVADAMLSGARIGTANDPSHNPAFFVPALVFAGACAVIAIARRVPSRRVAGALLVAYAVVDLGTFAWFQYWRAPVTASMLEPPPAALALHDELARSHQRIFSVAGSASPGVGIAPNVSLLWGIPAAGGYVSLLLTSPGIFLQLFVEGTMSDALLFDGADRSLDLAAIKYVVIAPERAAALLAARPGWRLREQSGVGAVLENPHAEPRARIVHRVIPMSPDAALAAIRSGAIDTRTTVLEQGPDALDTQPDPADAVDITALDDDDMHVNVVCRTACFLETSDTYSGMWHATIDGAAVPLRLTDYTLRGVAVPAGRHVVVFTYRPWIVALGGVISLAALALVVVLLVRSWRDERVQSASRFEQTGTLRAS